MIFLALIISTAYAGMSVEAVSIIIAMIVLIGMIAYFTFDHPAILLNRAKIVGEANGERLYRILDGLSKTMGLKTPRLAMIQDPVPDIYFSGTNRDHMVIFVTSGLLAAYSDKELKAIITCELEMISETDSFVYNLVYLAFTRLLSNVRRIERSLRLKDKSIDGNTRSPDLKIDRADISDVTAVARSLIANDMYNYFRLHDLNRLAREKSPFFLVAYDNSRPVGFILGEVGYSLFRRSGHLCKIAIDEEHRRKGIGQSLITAFVGIVERSGCGSCYVEVRTDNMSAISMYKKFEFLPETVIRQYYADGSDCIKMVKSLTKAN